MSFGRSFTGTPAEILESLKDVATEVQTADRFLAPEVAAQHQDQLAALVGAVKHLFARIAPGLVVQTGGFSGHANLDGSGQIYLSIVYARPTVATSAEPNATPSDAPTTDATPEPSDAVSDVANDASGETPA
jgi:hypothetical protein